MSTPAHLGPLLGLLHQAGFQSGSEILLPHGQLICSAVSHVLGLLQPCVEATGQRRLLVLQGQGNRPERWVRRRILASRCALQALDRAALSSCRGRDHQAESRPRQAHSCSLPCVGGRDGVPSPSVTRLGTRQSRASADGVRCMSGRCGCSLVISDAHMSCPAARNNRLWSIRVQRQLAIATCSLRGKIA